MTPKALRTLPRYRPSKSIFFHELFMREWFYLKRFIAPDSVYVDYAPVLAPVASSASWTEHFHYLASACNIFLPLSSTFAVGIRQ